MSQAAASNRKADRRVAYTNQALRKALIRLMQDQHISGITVKALCETADVNRSTFYLHYRDQYDLLRQIEQEVLSTVRERLMEAQAKAATEADSRPITLEAMTEILEYARENADLARVLLSENCDFAFQQDIMELTQLVTILPDDSFDARMKNYIITYATNGCIALAEKWLDEGMKEPPAEFAQLMLQVLYFGTFGFIEITKK